jgi:hypothetical protein
MANGQMDKAENSSWDFSVAYNGSQRRDLHSMDIETLAPTLQAFARLLKECNFEVNGKAAKAEIFIVSEFEHKCFQINMQLVIDAVVAGANLLPALELKTAKEILDWIGLIKESKSAGVSFLGYLGWKKGQKVHEVITSNPDNPNSVTVKVEGNHNTITINKNILNLSNNPKALKAARDILTPIGVDGFETFEIKQDGIIAQTISPAETEAIIASCNNSLQEIADQEPLVETTTAWLTPYSPVYDSKAKNWQFNYGADHIYADISETDIAQRALESGGALVQDSYQVRLEITTPRDATGNLGKAQYKILTINKFVGGTAATQGDLFGKANRK